MKKKLGEFSSKQLEPILELGVSNIGAVLYLTTLKHGILSVLELSKITEINRQQIYEEAEKLIQLGLLEITRKHKRKYIAVSPNKLLKIAKQKINDAENAFSKIGENIPFLESLPQGKNEKPIIKYFEGLSGIKTAYEKELDNCHGTEVISLAGSIDDIYKFFPEIYWNKWNKQFVLQKSSSRMLCHNSIAAEKTSKSDLDYKRQTRYLENFPLKVNIDVFGETVLVVSYYDKFALWIDSKILSDSYRIMFETLWPLSKRF